jgi:hypothetical protein
MNWNVSYHSHWMTICRPTCCPVAIEKQARTSSLMNTVTDRQIAPNVSTISNASDIRKRGSKTWKSNTLESLNKLSRQLNAPCISSSILTFGTKHRLTRDQTLQLN